MSKIIPPLLSNSPPPITEPLDDEDDDEFGDFTSAVDLSCNCEALSLPSSPNLSPQKRNSSTDETLDINSNTNKKLEDFEKNDCINESFHITINKDYQDKRKKCDTSSILSENIIETEVNLTQHTTSPQICINSVNSFEVDTSSFIEQDGKCEYSESILPNNSVPIVDTDENTELNEIKKANSKKNFDAPNEHKIKIDFSVPDCSGFKETEDLRDFASTAVVDLNVPCSLNETELLSDADESDERKRGMCNDVEEPVNEDFKTSCIVEENDFNLAEHPGSKRLFENPSGLDITQDECDNVGKNDIVSELQRCSLLNCENNLEENPIRTSENEKLPVPVDSGLYYFDEPPELNIKDDDEEFDDFNYYTSNAYDIDDESETTIDVNELPYDSTASVTVQKFDENPIKNKSKNEEMIFVFKDKSHDDFEDNLAVVTDDLKLNDFINNVANTVDVVNETNNIVNCGDAEEIINETTSQQISLNFFKDPKTKIVNSPLHDDLNVENIGDINDGFMEIQSQLPKHDKDMDTDFGKFADFTTFGPECQETPAESYDDFGEFNEFQNSKLITETTKGDDFGEFDNDDDFGDFDDYTNASSLPGFVSLQDTLNTEFIDGKNVLQRVETIIVEMFPFSEEVNDEFSDADIIQDDFVYREIKDITETNALSYQWGKSSSQDNLLNALNIDTRNILYGPGWNPSMPKFAANLSLAPLEPIKPDILTATVPLNVVSNSSQSSYSNQPASSSSEVPTAQFDWSGSGLTNPLDYTSASTMLLDIEQLVASLDINNGPTVISLTPSPVDDFDQWEYWLKSLPKGHQELSTTDQNRSESIKLYSNDIILESQISSGNQVRTKPCLQSDSDSVNSLQLTTDTPQDIEDNTKSETITIDDFKEFATYKSSQDASFPNWSSTNLPLRETYISNQHTNETTKKAELENDNGEPGWLKPTILTPDLPRRIQTKKEFDDDFTNFQSFNDVKEKETSSTHNLDDDFSDFQSIAVKNVSPTNHSQFNNNKGLLLPTTIQPLKPIVLQRQVSLETSTQINWPDPGITEDDIMNIELNYSNNRAGTELCSNSALEYQNIEMRKDVNKVVKQPNGIGNDDFKICQNKSVDQHIQVLHTPIQPTFNIQNISTQNTFSEKQIQPVSKVKPKLRHTETSDLRRNSLLNSNQIQGLTVTENNSSLKNCDDDDDEWSDFVCNPEPIQLSIQAKSTYATLMQPERTNTPELQLSVPHLSQLQPPKLPIPVITPHGLIQTKIPSNVPSINTIMQPSVLSNQAQSNGSFQPSIISNQYQNHISGLAADKLIFGNNQLANSSNFKPYTNGFTQQMKSQSLHKSQIQPNIEKPQLTSKSNEDDDDDWTDFISSPPVQSRNAPELNVISKDFDWQTRGPLFNSWSTTSNNMTPNIITNPVHFDSFRSYIPQSNNVLGSKTNRKVTNVALHSKRTAVPSISAMPDLDFVAPRNRTFTKK